MPAGCPRYSSGIRVLFLMTARAVQSCHALALRTPNDVGKMTVSIVALLRIIAGRVTVDAPLVHRPFLVPLVAIVGGLVLSAIDMANAKHR